ncbi:hypothetical protein BY996DRAFT_6561307 [Phakopsora pachyrhizi]|uniref:Uncharacterized protein n=1 Tax=Phakopsora pachyrhizi TaxID=170000 RepID=A0AAV0B2X9_PHAPC|nr:hypothetical protein BY996DRAFT_6561307 [Phakopsora pachyrhizi]CAH7676782.1 hypothetical protein PPACK8108_LOCUS11877 [Phakopsora pachyrhizi]
MSVIEKSLQEREKGEEEQGMMESLEVNQEDGDVMKEELILRQHKECPEGYIRNKKIVLDEEDRKDQKGKKEKNMRRGARKKAKNGSNFDDGQLLGP